MIIHLLASAQHLQEDLPFLKAITEVVYDNDSLLARDWVGAAEVRVIKNGRRDDAKTDWESVHQENCAAILFSDIVIIEATVYGFMQGYYAALAGLHKKPTLIVLRQQGIVKRLLTGIDKNTLTIVDYETVDQLRKIVRDFIKSTHVDTTPFDAKLQLNPIALRRLNKIAEETGQEKSTLISDIVTKYFQN